VTDWATFAGFAGVVLAGLLLLSHLSSRQVRPPDAASDPPTPTPRDRTAPGTGGDRPDGSGAPTGPGGAAPARPLDLPAGYLLANVALSQGVFGLLLLVGAWYARVPATAFGAGRPTPDAVAAGVGLGVALYAGNEVGAALGDRLGIGRSEAVRAALAPSSPGGWALLLGVVLPVIAGVEEILFRGALVGALSVGFGVSPWLLAALSSVAFALGHGAQGPAGVAVTGLLGFALAAAFVVTGSLLAVVVAHYLVNALEFVVHEGVGAERGGRGG